MREAFCLKWRNLLWKRFQVIGASGFFKFTEWARKWRMTDSSMRSHAKEYLVLLVLESYKYATD